MLMRMILSVYIWMEALASFHPDAYCLFSIVLLINDFLHCVHRLADWSVFLLYLCNPGTLLAWTCSQSYTPALWHIYISAHSFYTVDTP